MSSLQRVIATIATFCLFFITAQPSQAQGSGKLGIGYDDGATTATKNGLQNMGPKAWYYNWAPTANANLNGREFVPMIHHWEQANADTLAAAKRSGGTLLGFNEPDGGGNLSAGAAAWYWNQLEATGMRLGSPAMAGDPSINNPWLDQFLAGWTADGHHPRIDFVTVHIYPAWTYPNDPAADPIKAADDIMAELERIHNKYNKPLWLTEFAMNVFAGTKIPTPQQQKAFMTNILPRLEACPYMERYCWWMMKYFWDGNPLDFTSDLMDTNGNLNDLGYYYKQFGGEIASIANGPHTLAPAHATGTRLDAAGWGTTNGTNIGIYNANGQGNQVWQFTYTGNGAYKIQPAYAFGLCLDVNYANSNVQLWADNGGYNQRWTLFPVTAGYALAPLSAPGTRLDVAGFGGSGANVGVYNANNQANQVWQISK